MRADWNRSKVLDQLAGIPCPEQILKQLHVRLIRIRTLRPER